MLAQWRYTYNLSTQVHLTSGSTYPILARLATTRPATKPATGCHRYLMPPGGSRQSGPSGTAGRVRTLGKPLHALPAITAIVLTPWTVGITTQLPHLAVEHHWNTAWASEDVAIAIGLALTSWLANRRDARAALAATATATLMCAHGRFNLCTPAPGHPFAYAVAETTAELMVAAVCLVIGLRTQQDADGRPSDDLRLSGQGPM
jgi:hypothetical protein